MIRCVRVAAACAGVMAGAFSLTGHAGQARSVADRVYTAGQAARGQQIYKARCAECHGSGAPTAKVSLHAPDTICCP